MMHLASRGAARWRVSDQVVEERTGDSDLVDRASVPGGDPGLEHEKTAREAGVSGATISRAMRGMPVRGLTALQLVQAFRRHAPVPELIDLVSADDAWSTRVNVRTLR
ncbi:MAG: hypothetical protein J2P57_13160 [Acidimicrobiaceae bacterium]|nr:hypothetical protein [Acidimicrobiaceae bacterium]